jgi:hypothetical protein
MVRHLRTVAPPPSGCSVKVSFVKESRMDGDLGSCEKHGRSFRISLREDLTEQETEDTLIHEWAHMLCWRPYHPLTSDHGADFGVFWAAVFRKYHGKE